MNKHFVRRVAIGFGCALSGALLPAIAMAQQSPNPQPVAPPAASATAPSFHANDVGDTTRYLLQLQASGAQAGKPLPMLGDEATASYRRYLKSFEHPIPEYFDTTVGKTAENGR
jgi:hypothetical protein